MVSAATRAESGWEEADLPLMKGNLELAQAFAEKVEETREEEQRVEAAQEAEGPGG